MSGHATLEDAPFKPLGMRGPGVEVERRADGVILMRSLHPLGEEPQSMAHVLDDRAQQHPERPFLRQRREGGGPWRTLTYGEAAQAAEGIAQFLIDHDLGPASAVLVLSGNSLEHAQLMLGAMAAGVPIVPISPAFSLVAEARPKLLHCAQVVQPSMVFAQTAAGFAPAIEALQTLNPNLTVLTADGANGTIALSSIALTPVTGAVEARRDVIEPDDVAKVLFTSGSTGLPKAVPQTHRMLTGVLAALAGLREEEPAAPDEVAESLEWMPWSHIAAGNINFNGALFGGGTLYLDDGRPAPGLFDATIRNLREVSPIHFASAPIAFGMLADALERDESLRKNFFRNLRYMAYGGATLSNDIYERLERLAVAETGYRIPLTTMYGSTETQGITMTHWATERVGLVGLPLPGITLKLTPNGPKLEVRVKGATVMPGYVGDRQRTAEAFDEEGFYKLGDAVRFVDETDPSQGLIFDGRVTEDFKLDSGTWVSVGVLRPDLLATCSPYLQDAVICGQDRGYVSALVWPSAVAVSAFEHNGSLDVAALTAVLQDRLREHNRSARGSSRRIERFSIAPAPLSLVDGEITDKGYVNQRAVLESRAQDVEQLYRTPPPEGVVLVGA